MTLKLCDVTRRGFLTGVPGLVAASGLAAVPGLATVALGSQVEKKENKVFSDPSKVVFIQTLGGHGSAYFHASAVVCNNKGKVLKQFAPGDAERGVNIHSCVKPFHAAIMLEYIRKNPDLKAPGFDSAELAVMSASHSGTPEHLQWIQSVLDKAELDEGYMRCVGYPLDQVVQANLKAQGRTISNISHLYSQCSGHHACQGILAKLMDEDPKDYWKPEGKVQQYFLKQLQEYCDNDQRIELIKFDGCGIPTFNMPLATFATLYAKFVSSEQEGFKRVVDAMAKHPFLVSDEISLDTCLMEVAEGKLIAKLGSGALIIIANRATGEAMILREWSAAYGIREKITIQALSELGWITGGQAQKLWDNPHFSLKCPNPYGVYEFNEPLWD